MEKRIAVIVRMYTNFRENLCAVFIPTEEFAKKLFQYDTVLSY